MDFQYKSISASFLTRPDAGGVFSTIAANFWIKGWRHVYHLIFKAPFGLSLGRTLQVGSSS
jgi:hypothetical protein